MLNVDLIIKNCSVITANHDLIRGAAVAPVGGCTPEIGPADDLAAK